MTINLSRAWLNVNDSHLVDLRLVSIAGEDQSLITNLAIIIVDAFKIFRASQVIKDPMSVNINLNT